MNFLMFSCSHFFQTESKASKVLCRKEREREHKVTSAESSAMAKPRSTNLVMAKPRPFNLVSYNMLRAKKDPPHDMSDSDTPGNAKAEQGGVSTCLLKQMRDTSQYQYQAEHSQARQQQNTPNADSWKQEKRSDSSDSNRLWKQMRSVGTHMKKSETGFCNVQNPNQQNLGKFSEICKRSWRSRKSHQHFGSKPCRQIYRCCDYSCHPQ